MSMVIPRRFSSSSRSASMPVSALTRAVFPWSMWPAVPTIMFFMPSAFILLLASAASAVPSAAQQGESPVFRAGVSLVKVDTQVVDHNGRVVSRLTAAGFRIYDNGQPQKIAHFGADAEPLDLLLLLDVSGSMHKNLEQMAATARGALK